MLPKSLVLLLLASFIDADFNYPRPYQFLSCPQPMLDHGRVYTKQRTRLVKFMCARRYELVGNRYATCRNGQWDVPMPVCVRSGCKDLPVSPNSIQIKEHQDAWVVTFCLPGHNLVGSSTIFCDGHKWNDTAPKCVDASSLITSLRCDFEDQKICGWTQDELHDFDWKRWNKVTPSAFLFTGPSYDHTYGKNHMGYYMYIESTSQMENDTARLLSPIYDSALSINGCFNFFYHMYGKDIGGLRVYQKPDSIFLYEMLNQTEGNGKYLLFEQWGEQGNSWYSASPQLLPVGEDFQIVIEGIRGASYQSDIAIDDVAILQGENCTQARAEASTPEPALEVQSCAGRCNKKPMNPSACECAVPCLFRGTCCPDYFDACLYSEDLPSSTDSLPETQKLVGETTTTKPTTASKTTTQSSRTTTTTTTTPKPRTTTTAKPTTTAKTTTTARTTTTTTKPSTTAKPTTKAKTTELTTTAKTTAKTTTKRITTLKAITTPKITTTAATITINVTVDESQIEKNKQEDEVNLNKMAIKAPKYKTKSSTWKTAVITVVLLALCVSLIYLGVTARSARGRQALARLRGRTNHDSEVRYLNSAADDDL